MSTEKLKKEMLKIELKNYIIERLDRHGFRIQKLCIVKKVKDESLEQEYKTEGYYGTLDDAFSKVLQLKIEDDSVTQIKDIKINLNKGKDEIINILKTYKNDIIKDIKDYSVVKK